jgi:O-antigen ligase
MILRRVSLYTLYLAVMAACVMLAVPAQMAEYSQIAMVAFILGAWLLSSLFFGMNLRTGLIFSALFFIKPLPVSYYCVLGVISFSLIAEYYHSGRLSLSLPYPVAGSVLLATCVYGLARATDFGHAATYFISTAVIPLLMLIVISNSRLGLKDYVAWLKMIVVIGALLGVIGMAMGMMNPSERLGSLWITAMTINGFYTLGFFFAIALGMREKGPSKRWLWYGCAVLIFLGMLYTYTRIALVAVIFGFLLLMLRLKRFRYIGFGALLLVPLVIPASMMQRIQMSFTFDFSIFIRLLAWYHALNQIIAHPVFGIGIGVWKDWYMGIVPYDFLYAEHPHNLYLKILLEIGVFGFLAYFWIVGSIIRRYWRKVVKPAQDNFDRVVLIGVLALLFSCLTDIFAQQYSISLAFWITLGFMYIRARDNHEPDKIEEQ